MTVRCFLDVRETITCSQQHSELSWLMLVEPTCLLILTVNTAQLILQLASSPRHSMTASKQGMFLVPLVFKRALEHREPGTGGESKRSGPKRPLRQPQWHPQECCQCAQTFLQGEAGEVQPSTHGRQKLAAEQEPQWLWRSERIVGPERERERLQRATPTASAPDG